MPRRTTMADIARRAGVSRYTVSRILKGETQGKWAVTAERAGEIRAIARELGYRPNTAAQATASGRFGAVALLTLADGSDYLASNVIRALVHHLGRHDLQLSVEVLGPQSLEDDEHLPKLLRARSVDGFLISTGGSLPRGLRQWLQDGGLPAVWLNRKHPRDCVRPDDRGAAKRLVRILAERGHRRIAYLPPTNRPPRFRFTGTGRELLGWSEPRRGPRHYSEADRLAGYRAGCAAVGIDAQVWEPCAADPATALAELEQRLRREGPRAVICYRKREAELLRLAAAGIGRPLSDELAVSSFTWGDFAAPAVGLATMDINVHRFAEDAATLIRARIAAPDQRQASVTVPFQWTELPR